MRSIIFLILASFVTNVFALEIDEKLTLRILSVSKSKKTVLVNRGLEDGLVVGDHAKFFLTTGVKARGVIVKASPTRSIWSLYRLIEEESLVKDTVMNLKISSALKLTEDPSKVVFSNPKVPAGDDEMALDMEEAEKKPLAEVPSDLPIEEKEELKTLTTKVTRSERSSKSWEVWAMMNVNSLSGEYSDQDIDASSSSSFLDFGAGVAKYFPDSSSFVSHISLGAFFNYRKQDVGGVIQIGQSWTEFGGQLCYNFYNPVGSVNKPIFYAVAGGGFGTATFQTTNENDANTTTVSNLFADADGLEGNSTFVFFGAGVRYLTSYDIGFLGQLDYYSSTTDFTVEDDTGDTADISYSLAGPRVRFGLSYRF